MSDKLDIDEEILNFASKIDADLFKLASRRLDISMDVLFEKLIKSLLFYDDAESKAIKKVLKKRKELESAENSLISLINIKHDVDVDVDVKKSIDRIYKKCGSVGLDQLGKLSKSYNIPAKVLEDYCCDNRITLVKYQGDFNKKRLQNG